MSKLPEGWKKTFIGELTLPISKINLKSESDRHIKYIDISSIDNQTNTVVDAKTLSLANAPSRARQIVKENDILFSTVRPYLRNIAAVPKELDGEIASTGFSVLRPVSLIEPRYLYYYCISDNFVDAISSEQYGVSYPAVKDSQVRLQSIPLPPMNEQTRIVGKLDQIMAEINSIQKRLDKIPHILKKFRQSVYDSAAKGLFSSSWRNSNHLPETQALIEMAYHVRQKEKGFKETFAEKDTFLDIELPDNWVVLNLDKLCSTFTYGTSKKSKKHGRIPVLRMGNIQGGIINWDDLVYTSDKHEIEKYKLSSGDVLFNRTNSPELVGKTAIYRGEYEAIYAGYLIKISPPEYLNPEYLNICLNTSFAKDYCWRVKTDGVSQSNINAKKLGKMPIPFCSLKEQEIIVERTLPLFAVADQIEEKYASAFERIDKILQSILQKAFGGELVPQDPKDEAASILLQKIKEEKELQVHNLKLSRVILEDLKVKRSNNKPKSKHMIKKLQDVLSEKQEWLSAQEVFELCGIGNGSLTEEIETLYAELRHLDKLGKLAIDTTYDSNGMKQFDRIKLKKAG